MSENIHVSPDIPYKEALERIEQIVHKLQGDNCDVDTMVARAREAAELIKVCRSRLTSTEDELKKILDSLRSE